ncbi:MAG: acyl-CoA thioester hydrolase/BAAT C-terminal domain-containing protein [Bryobacteraceae bacterium]
MRTALILLAFVIPVSVAAQAPAAYLDVRDGGMVAHVYRPPGTGRAPAVLLLGGSGGGIGWQDEMAKLLGARGVVAMALAYYGMDNLPKQLERIPLEYFDHAIDWLARQDYVDPKKIAIGGVSKGSELALLVASRRPEICGVAAFAPSGLVFQSVAAGYPLTSSWSLKGKDVPFVPYGKVDNPKSTGDFYRAGIAQAESLDAATIPVEKIRGPILLLSGREDNLWPSTMLAERVVNRLREHGFQYPVEHVSYPDAGHLISSIRKDDVTRRGGTADGNTKAQLDGQRRFLEFFDKLVAGR